MSNDQGGCEWVSFFWYRPTRVVPDQRPWNGCVCVCVCVWVFVPYDVRRWWWISHCAGASRGTMRVPVEWLSRRVTRSPAACPGREHGHCVAARHTPDTRTHTERYLFREYCGEFRTQVSDTSKSASSLYTDIYISVSGTRQQCRASYFKK